MGNNRINQIDLVDAVYEKLVLSNLNDIKGAVECVAETFSGININGTVRSEPMNVALKLDKKTIESFLNHIISEVVADGYSFVAKDRKSGKVVGVELVEIYAPERKTQVFSGAFEKYNDLFEFLDKLDVRFKELYEYKSGKPLKKGHFLHVLSIAIRGKAQNGNIFDDLSRLIESSARENKLLGIFCEATNPRSQKPYMERHGYININAVDGTPILLKYKDHPLFKNIPKEIAEDCKLLYKPIELFFE